MHKNTTYIHNKTLIVIDDWKEWNKSLAPWSTINHGIMEIRLDNY